MPDSGAWISLNFNEGMGYVSFKDLCGLWLIHVDVRIKKSLVRNVQCGMSTVMLKKHVAGVHPPDQAHIVRRESDGVANVVFKQIWIEDAARLFRNELDTLQKTKLSKLGGLLILNCWNLIKIMRNLERQKAKLTRNFQLNWSIIIYAK